MATTSINEAIQDLVKEEIFPTVQDLLPAEDPTWRKIKPTSVGVERAGGLGRNWIIKQVYTTGLAGQVEPFDPYADDMTTSTSRYTGMSTRGLDSGYPNPIGTPLKNTLVRNVLMAGVMGNINFPLELMLNDQLNATMIKYVAANMKGWGRRLALAFINWFFAPTNGALCGIGATVSSLDGDASGGIQQFSIRSGTGRVQSMKNNMLVDIYQWNGTTTWTKLNVDSSGADVPCVIDGIDYLNKYVRIVSVDGRALASAVGDYDTDSAQNYVFARGAIKGSPASYTGTVPVLKGPMGYHDWVKAAASSTYILDPTATEDDTRGIDLGKYPEFASSVNTSTGTLTEQTLNLKIGEFYEAFGINLDTIVTTLGVTEKYAEQPLLDGGRQVYDRTGQVLKFTGGRASVGYALEGDSFDWVISRYISSGTMLIAKLNGGNIKLYVPPRLQGTGSRSEFDYAVQFVAPVLGYNGVFAPVRSDDQIQRSVQAPMEMLGQVVPDIPNAIEFTGVTEAS